MANSKNLDILISVGGLIDEMQKLAEKNGEVLYNILYREAGWGVMWSISSYRGQVFYTVYDYYPTLEKMVYGEIARLSDDVVFQI